MKKYNQLNKNLRLAAGLTIMTHGLLRIIFIGKYIEFVLDNFGEAISADTALTIGAALFPFIEFFTGMLIAVNIGYKKSIIAGFMISIVMSAFIIAGSLYPRLIYHLIVFGMLSVLYLNTKPSGRVRLLRKRS